MNLPLLSILLALTVQCQVASAQIFGELSGPLVLEGEIGDIAVKAYGHHAVFETKAGNQPAIHNPDCHPDLSCVMMKNQISNVVRTSHSLSITYQPAANITKKIRDALIAKAETNDPQLSAWDPAINAVQVEVALPLDLIQPTATLSTGITQVDQTPALVYFSMPVMKWIAETIIWVSQSIGSTSAQVDHLLTPEFITPSTYKGAPTLSTRIDTQLLESSTATPILQTPTPMPTGIINRQWIDGSVILELDTDILTIKPSPASVSSTQGGTITWQPKQVTHTDTSSRVVSESHYSTTKGTEASASVSMAVVSTVSTQAESSVRNRLASQRPSGNQKLEVTSIETAEPADAERSCFKEACRAIGKICTWIVTAQNSHIKNEQLPWISTAFERTPHILDLTDEVLERIAQNSHIKNEQLPWISTAFERTPHILDLTDEVLGRIFSYCCPKRLCALRRTCSRFNRAITSDVWKSSLSAWGRKEIKQFQPLERDKIGECRTVFLRQILPTSNVIPADLGSLPVNMGCIRLLRKAVKSPRRCKRNFPLSLLQEWRLEELCSFYCMLRHVCFDYRYNTLLLNIVRTVDKVWQQEERDFDDTCFILNSILNMLLTHHFFAYPKCDQLVTTHMEYLFDLVRNNLSEAQVCSLIGIYKFYNESSYRTFYDISKLVNLETVIGKQTLSLERSSWSPKYLCCIMGFFNDHYLNVNAVKIAEQIAGVISSSDLNQWRLDELKTMFRYLDCPAFLEAASTDNFLRVKGALKLLNEAIQSNPETQLDDR